VIEMIKYFFQSQWTMMVYAALTGIMATVVMIWSKHKLRWVLVLAIAAWGVFLLAWFVGGRLGGPPMIDPQLPAYFRLPLPWWLFVLMVAGLLLTVHLVILTRRLGWWGEGEVSTGEARFPELEAAWHEILAALAQARIDPARQSFYLLAAPSANHVEELIGASDLQEFVRSPVSETALIRAHAVNEGLLLNFAALTGLADGETSQAGALEALCQWIRDLNPELPSLRGVCLVLPLDWAVGPEAPRRAAALRDDLQAIAITTGVRCPVIVVLSNLDRIAGGTEFLSRLTPEFRAGLCGFTLPVTDSFQPDTIARGLAWLSRWFQVWSLRLMAQDYEQASDNGQILNIYGYFWQHRQALGALLNAIFTPPPQAQPPMLRRIYVAAPSSGGFVRAILRGARGRLYADRDLTTWCRDARRRDHRDRNLAIALGVFAAASVAMIWMNPIESRIPRVGWAGLIILAVVWLITLAVGWFRRRPQVPATAVAPG
jgi:hypothetical protein